MNNRWRPTLVYSFAHFSVDLGCAYAMFSACQGSPICFLLYNFCAFAMQMPMGLVADALNRNRLFALLGAAVVAVVCLFPSFGWLGAVILGLGNGLFHIGGGLDVMNLSGNKAAPLGVFVSPGAYGIYLGTLLGHSKISCLPVLAVLLMACAGMCFFCRSADLADHAPLDLPSRRVLPGAILLFAVVILRSYGGLAATFEWKTGLWAFAAISAVVLGKTLGGFLSDRIGLFSAAAGSLLISALLFCFSHRPVPGVLALLLFNMTMPMTLHALAQSMPGTKGFSFGLLTFALFLGFLPTYFGTPGISGIGMAITAVCSALLLLPGIRLCRRYREVSP